MEIIKKFKESAWKRTCVYIDPTHREEDGTTGKRISKDHSWSIAEVSGVLGSESLQNYHQAPPTSPQVARRVARKKPLLSINNKLKRLQFAKCKSDFQWDRVIWSDETKIKLFGNK